MKYLLILLILLSTKQAFFVACRLAEPPEVVWDAQWVGMYFNDPNESRQLIIRYKNVDGRIKHDNFWKIIEKGE